MKVRITTVRRRTIRVAAGPPPPPPRAECASCGREVEAVTREQAVEILAAEDRELSEFIAAGHVHAIPLAGGRLRVCKESLFPK